MGEPEKFDEVSEPHEKLGQKELAKEYAKRIFAVDIERDGIDEIINLRDEAAVMGFGGLLNLAIIDYFETNIMRLMSHGRKDK